MKYSVINRGLSQFTTIQVFNWLDSVIDNVRWDNTLHSEDNPFCVAIFGSVSV